MIRSRHENRKPFAPNVPKIPTRQHRCNKAIERGRLFGLRVELRAVDDEGDVNHLLIRRIGFLTQSVRQTALAMIRVPSDFVLELIFARSPG